MKNSLFEVLDKENLNRLKISYDYRTDKIVVYAAKEWENDHDFSRYNKDFSEPDILTSDLVVYNDKQSREIFKKNGSEEYLNKVINLIREGKHQFIDCYYNKKKNIRFENHAHSDILGRNNRSQAVRAGGIRRHSPQEDEIDVIIDGLNLGRGMSFKNFAARIPFGGSKITVIMDPIDLKDLEAVGFLAYCLDRSRCFTGPDMNFPTELADVMKEHFSINITGGPKGPLGETGVPTAYGVFLAVKEAAKFRWGSDDLKGKKAAVSGLGAVGYYLAEHFIKEGAELFVSDINKDAVARLIDNHPKAEITYIEPEDIIYQEVDILSPCAVGGIFHDENIGKLKAQIIIGGANNQLKASGRDEEVRLANLVKERGILFQEAWWHNGGGVLCGHEEYMMQDNAKMENVLRETEKTCKFTYQNLEEAHRLGISPTENCYRQVEKFIYA